MPEIDAALHHHGDDEATAGMVDYAVNTVSVAPPAGLAAALHAAVAQCGAYPRVEDVHRQAASFLGVPSDCLLLTNGASEAFSLVARAQPWAHPVMIHPQFTEPEVALRAVGRPPHHLLLKAESGFRLGPSLPHLSAEADLVVVGNPTNPTSVLHPREHILALRAPARVLVVDEAFMDVTDGQQSVQHLAAAPHSGMLVVRSWTKTYALAGARVGALIGDPELIAACRRHQPHWSVNSFAVAALEHVLSPAGEHHRAQVAGEVQRHLRECAHAWTGVGGCIDTSPHAPFLLLRHPLLPQLHASLREHGVAVRRCNTFPGLDEQHIRVAARSLDQWHPLLTAVRALLSAQTFTSGAA